MGRRLASVAAAVFLAAAALVAGRAAAAPADNGISGKSPDQILASAITAGEHARSVHIVGNVIDGGQHIGIDAHFAGTRVDGRIRQSGVAFNLVVVGSKAYVKAGTAFWTKVGGTGGAAAAKLFANKWVEGSTKKGGIFAGLTSSFSLKPLLESFRSGHGKLETTGATKIHGQPAIGLRDTTQGGTLYIATTGQPYPLSIQQSGRNSGLVEFEDWNAPLTIKVPPKFIDGDALAKLGHP
jgi:hypothetical protein